MKAIDFEKLFSRYFNRGVVCYAQILDCVEEMVHTNRLYEFLDKVAPKDSTNAPHIRRGPAKSAQTNVDPRKLSSIQKFREAFHKTMQKVGLRVLF